MTAAENGSAKGLRNGKTPGGQPEVQSAVLTGGTPSGASVGGQPTDLSFTVSIPQIGAYRTQDHRYYWNGKGPQPSVTTILKVLDKPALVQWAKRTVAEMAVNRYEEMISRLNSSQGTEFGPYDIMGLPDAVAEGEPDSDKRKQQVIRWLASLPDYKRDIAAELGSSVHLLADMASRTDGEPSGAFEISEETKPYLEGFRGFLGWLEASGGQIISSEKMVWSEEGYAGTYDLLVRLPKAEPKQVDTDTDLWLLDIKTSKSYYPEYALQLIAYAYADWIIVEGNPMGYPMPRPSKYGVLHLRPDQYPDTGYRLIEYPLVEGDYVAFLGCLEVFRWKEQRRYTRSQLSKP